jgi:hypothetical protein
VSGSETCFGGRGPTIERLTAQLRKAQATEVQANMDVQKLTEQLVLARQEEQDTATVGRVREWLVYLARALTPPPPMPPAATLISKSCVGATPWVELGVPATCPVPGNLADPTEAGFSFHLPDGRTASLSICKK